MQSRVVDKIIIILLSAYATVGSIKIANYSTVQHF